VPECRACGADRVEPVVFAAQPTLATRAAASLEHRFAAAAQITSEAGTVMPGTLNRPDALAARVLVRDAKRLRVDTCVRGDRPPSDDRTRRRDNTRELVLIPMRVHTDHVIHLVCKHPV